MLDIRESQIRGREASEMDETSIQRRRGIQGSRPDLHSMQSAFAWLAPAKVCRVQVAQRRGSPDREERCDSLVRRTAFLMLKLMGLVASHLVAQSI